ncbi:MAG: glycosyltransferase family 4 protein [Tepidisphaeraceae bacterium]
MRVLLVSPLPGVDPACGDVTYTQSLLADPPQGVRYETYADAVARGAVRECANRAALRDALRTRRRVLHEFVRTAGAKAINLLRARHVLFWEPFRFFDVRPGEYDLIHTHAFSARHTGADVPQVASNFAALKYVYLYARGYSPLRTALMEKADDALGRLLGVEVLSSHLPRTSRLIVFTQWLKDWYVRHGVMPADRVDVAPMYLPTPAPASQSVVPKRIGFISKDFDARGGPTLLEAFKIVRQKRPDAELWIIGTEPRIGRDEAVRQGITWLPYVDRPRLVDEIIPSFDVFAFPTEYDGFLVVLEAMSYGIPVATSDYQAIPELLDHGRAGLVSPMRDAMALANNVLRLLEPEANAQYRAAVRERFVSTYSSDAARPKLRQSYDKALLHRHAEQRRSA